MQRSPYREWSLDLGEITWNSRISKEAVSPMDSTGTALSYSLDSGFLGVFSKSHFWRQSLHTNFYQKVNINIFVSKKQTVHNEGKFKGKGGLSFRALLLQGGF